MKPKDILTNPNFCPMPWTGLMYNFDGEVKNCIRSAGPLGDIKTQSIESILLDNNNPRQQNILEHNPVDTCHTCYDLERGKKNINMISDRIFYIRELKHIDTNTYRENNFDLKTIDVRWSNLCNFACVYCGPQFSSKWAQELSSHFDVPTDEQRNKFKEYILHNASKLKHVYLAGGEPLLMKENLELLEILKKENTDITIRINTNLSKVDTAIFDRICEFENVHWTISVESQGDEFEYIRYGGKWSDFLENLDIISKRPHKVSFNMLHFLLNYMSLFDCVDFLVGRGFHHNSFIIGALLTPDYLNIRQLPSDVLKSVERELITRINKSPGFLLEESYRNLLAYIQQPFESDIETSFKRLAELDLRRHIDSSKIFKDLYKIKT